MLICMFEYLKSRQRLLWLPWRKICHAVLSFFLLGLLWQRHTFVDKSRKGSHKRSFKRHLSSFCLSFCLFTQCHYKLLWFVMEIQTPTMSVGYRAMLVNFIRKQMVPEWQPADIDAYIFVDTELNKNGLNQAACCGERLKLASYDHVYCSDLKRCKQV